MLLCAGRSQPVTVRRSSGPKSSTDVGSKSPAGGFTDKTSVMRRAQAARAARHKQGQTIPLSSDTVASVDLDGTSTAGSLGSMSSSQSSNSGLQSGVEAAYTTSEATNDDDDHNVVYSTQSDPALPVESPASSEAEITTANSSAASVAVDALQELSLSGRANSECGGDGMFDGGFPKNEGHITEGCEPSASSSVTSDCSLLTAETPSSEVSSGAKQHIAANPASRALEELSRLACE